MKKEKAIDTKVLVHKQFFKDNKEVNVSEIEETLFVNKFLVEPASVRVEYGLTLNLGNYESAKVTVSLSVPCYTEQLDEAYDYAKNFVSDKVIAEVNEIRKMR